MMMTCGQNAGIREIEREKVEIDEGEKVTKGRRTEERERERKNSVLGLSLSPFPPQKSETMDMNFRALVSRYLYLYPFKNQLFLVLFCKRILYFCCY